MVKPAKTFWHDEEGNFTFYVLGCFLIIFVMGGFGSDVMRYEYVRSKLQSNLDNATLAATSLRSTDEPITIISDYFDVANLPDYDYELSIISQEISVVKREVTSELSTYVPFFFTKPVGVAGRGLTVRSSAIEASQDLEISLILDITGSMTEEDRLVELKPAAQNFVSTMLAANDIRPDSVTINLVPYSMQVNAGKDLIEALGVSTYQDYSHCVHFDTNDYTVLDIDPVDTAQMAHLAYSDTSWDSWGDTFIEPFCRTDDYTKIIPLSSNETLLHDQISAFEGEGNTSIEIAMKWGAALLDPANRTALSALSALNADDLQYVPSAANNRPVDFDDSETLKIIILMTDGENTTEYGLKQSYFGAMSNVYYDDWNDNDPDTYSYSLDWGDPDDQVSWTTLFENMPLYDYLILNGEYTVRRGRYNTNSYWPNYLDTTESTTKNTRLQEICTAAKDEGIIVFSIGYTAPSNGRTQLQNCATTPSYYYDATTDTIDDVFGSIANVVDKLKLVDYEETADASEPD